MTETLQPGIEQTIRRDIRAEIAAAGNNHITAKNIANIDALRQKDTMDRMLGLAQTRKGLDALIELHGKASER